MTNPYLQRPQRPNQPPTNNNRPQQPANRSGGNQGNNRGGGQGGGGNNPAPNNPEPSPWLGHPSDPNPQPHKTASFVEYLRWMRAPSIQHKEGTQVQLVSKAETQANYTERLNQMNVRTCLIAGNSNTFIVTCPWRIRVGGTKGPESMLLPAFDALGMPYIPSSTLRGVARAQGIREFMEQGMSRSQAKKEMAKYLGDLDAEDKHKTGKVIFFDAYPIVTNESNSGGLAVDIANSIWSWDDDNLKYSPNPNVFFSLKQVKFLIGIRKGTNCTDEILAMVKKWLIKGLGQGIGSQTNSGYGRLLSGQQQNNPHEFLRLNFELEGQLIHGRQTVTWRADKNRYDNKSIAEVRPVAFKNMMRYWFRIFARGVLPSHQVRTLEVQIFGGIEPEPTWGWLCVRVKEIDSPTNNRKKQSGILRLFTTNSLPEFQENSFKTFCKDLCWLMFRLGGVGQGARRPYYERQGNPRIRGCDLMPFNDEDFWQVPDYPQEFVRFFQQRLTSFYQNLATLTTISINNCNLLEVSPPNDNPWVEVADQHCRILIFQGDSQGNKSHALAVLHDRMFKTNGSYDRFLCGSTAKPSPIWIANVEDKNYQVVTVFGATQDPRKRFVDELRSQGAIQVFPLSPGR
ncbi:CRISPR-associated RAMP family protein [Gloeomargarita lithophora Alchichica-D10]|uniref:CRISPR-associated RAMP family protein n=1 Tax=Gloeomargarita lithophora Alchichica-D10 TaxID=1188229 RepID=A0A1J0AAG4_9CYAN|nr:type III-B CRISPR module RAMP protein Cmr6 [Gloeomargarita lithophora]APB32924.1 CRISPR-associated RAMP family protein [Gloeomargarita lithophora Alchichica-D10]